jgi:hypothetical protein
MKWPWVLLHFLIVTLALNFPVMVLIVRLPPYEHFMRLYGGTLPEIAINFMRTNEITDPNEFNILMIESGYGKDIMLPLLGLVSGVVLVLQAAFYVLAAFFLRLSRLNAGDMSFRERLGLLLFSSTLPVCLAALFGLWLPTVHIIVFYFAVILLGFHRNPGRG